MWNEETLDGMLCTPSEKLVQDMARLSGDIMILGAGGKMGPSLSMLAKRASDAAGTARQIIAVSRFSDPDVLRLLNTDGIRTIEADLLEEGALQALPECPNIVYMAGRKFGTGSQEPLTWAMNAWLPSRVAERFRNSRIVVFSSGNIYPMLPICSGGATEDTAPAPVGEYGMSCLARERMFEYASQRYGTPVLLYRLNYAVDLRYGVLDDIARSMLAGQPVSLTTPAFNCIWQGTANEMAIRCLLHCASPAAKLNITGPETVSVRYAAEKLGKLLGCEPVFEGTEGERAFLNNSMKATALFGYPSVSVETLIQWQAEWILAGGRSLGKPTHFEERKGNY